MPLPSQIQLSNTFGEWVNTTNQIITAVGNTSEYILVSQNATPAVSSGNVSINGVMTLSSLKANGGLGSSGQFLTSNGNNVYWSTLTVVDANSSTSGLVNTSAQTFAGNKTFDNNVAIIGYLTVGNSTITLNSTTLVLGNASSNLVMNSTSVTLNGSQVINSSGTANNAANLNGQAASYYTNASNLSTGTLAIARLDANVILTTSTTGINASAISTGTVPLARLSSANSSANGVVDTTTQSFAGNKSFLDTTTINALSANGGVGTSGQFLTSNGSTIYWSTLSVVDANSSTSGLVNTATQTFAGNKTFQNTTSFSDTVSITGAVNALSTLGVASTLNALGLLGVSGNATFAQDVVVTGNLTISGTTTYINTTNLQIGDNIIALNADLPDGNAPTESAGIEINRGSSANTFFRWNETGDVWEVTNDGTNYGTIIDTRSTTGINASALSTGTVPLGRLSSASTTANGVVDTTTQSFAGNKTFQNTTSFSNTVSITGAANALSTLGVGGAVNALSTLGVSGAVNALSTLGVSGIFTAAANSTLTGAVTMSNTATITGAATFSNTILMNANTSAGMTANGKLTLNTTNGRLVLPVGTNLWAL